MVYALDAGPVLPEMQAYTTIEIRVDAVVYTRRGKVTETEVQVGKWDLAFDEIAVAELLARLGAVDCSAIERFEPEDIPDGGYTESFTVLYADGASCTLTYSPGITYAGGEAITAPVRELVAGLRLPGEATD